ncbi:MAG: flavodoxin-dependent (E)-4-hydroxy-3-methylbut-2-enyl-diphosphate synthase [Eubacteriales bacterium]|nr:flavodoxin-dependent (E)-4-hydroxy-3-methylbut-2-enyl-diphosphate synthase [Eubacteriales bacterium]
MTKQVRVGGVPLGGGAPVTIQSMTNTDTADADATAAQINALAEAGCEIVRVSVYNEACAKALPLIKARTRVPLVADIHFDYRLAIMAMENGIDKLRINPGNIGEAARVRMVTDCAKTHHVPIRIGVNAGSLEKAVLQKYGGPTPEGMVESAMGHIHILEAQGFYDTVVSLKASNVPSCVAAYRLMHARSDYPLHIGVTEAGAGQEALVNSAVGLGALLMEGIGDTLRVSMTGDPLQEVGAAKLILRAAGLRTDGVRVTSCPTCGRTGFDLLPVVERVKAALADIEEPLHVAVMGCIVNGPGEAREADMGVAFGERGKKAMLFVHGEQRGVYETETAISRLIEMAKHGRTVR